MSIGAQFATRNEVEILRRKLERAISGAGISQHITITPVAENFIDLADTPSTYVAAGNFAVRVKSTVDELEFAALLGTTHQVTVTANAADYTLSLPQNIHTAATPTFAGMYLESDTIAPFLKLTNKSDTERDPVIQYAAGATPVTKWTHGLDDSDDNKWKLAVGDKFGEDYDTIVVSSGEGSAPPIAEFTLIDSFTTGTHLNPRGVCADANYVYYSFQDQLVKIDKTTGAELAISAAVPLNTYNMYSCVTDGTYVYVACRGNGKVRKYLCSDLTYDSTSEFWNASLTGLAYSFGYLYITSYGTNNIRKIRCSDMVTQWTTAFTTGAGDNQLDNPCGIAADNQYVYVQDLDNNRIVRLNVSDGSWVDATAVAQTFHVNSWAMWCAGDYLYNTAPYAVNDCKVEKRNKADLSISETFDMATNYATQGWQRDDYHYVVDGIAEYVYKYQYVSFGGAGNSHIKFRLKDAYGQFNDIAILTDEGRLGIGTMIPSETIEAVGNIKATAGQFISTKATGTAPLVVSSTTKCVSLNSDLWDDLHMPALVNAQFLTNNGTVLSWAAALSNPMTDIGDMIIGGAAGAPAKLADVAVGSYLASGGVTTAFAWAPLNQAAVAGLTTADDPLFDHVHTGHLAGSTISIAECYSTTVGHFPGQFFYKSHADTGVAVETINGDYLGDVRFYGVNTTPAFALGGFIRVQQNGDAGTYVPSNMYLYVYSASTSHMTLALTSPGGVHIGGTSDVAAGCLEADGTITATGGFVGLTTTDGPTFDHLHITHVLNAESLTLGQLGTSEINYLKTYSDTLSHATLLRLVKCHSDTEDVVRTLDTESLGHIQFWGVTATPALSMGAYIFVLQNGATGTYVPADMRFVTYGAEAAHYALTLTTSGGAHVGGSTDVEDNALLVDGKFGCNAKAVQGAYASGGAVAPGAGAYGASSAANFAALATLVANIRLALVADGIMS